MQEVEYRDIIGFGSTVTTEGEMTTEPKKRKKPFAANAASIKTLRGHGFFAEVVERRLPKCFITKDLFQCIDIVAIDVTLQNRGVLGVQVTTLPNVAARRTKILASPEAKVWVACGNRFVIHGWDKKTGFKPALRTYEVKLEDFA